MDMHYCEYGEEGYRCFLPIFALYMLPGFSHPSILSRHFCHLYLLIIAFLHGLSQLSQRECMRASSILLCILCQMVTRDEFHFVHLAASI